MEDGNFADRLAQLGNQVVETLARGSAADALRYEVEIDEMIRGGAADRGIRLDA
jgi:hypothetical protein